MAEEVEAAVRITLKDVWLAQQDTNAKVASLLEQLPNHISQTADDLSALREVDGDHEKRLRKLEERANKASWVPVLLASVLSIIGTAGLGALILNTIATK